MGAAPHAARPPRGDPGPAARALAALLAPRPDAPVLIDGASEPHVTLPGETLAQAALPRRLRDAGATVVVAHTIGPTLARALRERPPALLVITGPDPGDAPHLPHTLVLGPAARLRVRPAPEASPEGLVVCATSPAELTALLAALSQRTIDLSRETAAARLPPAPADLSRETAAAHLPPAPADLSRETAAAHLPPAPADLSRETAAAHLPPAPADLPRAPSAAPLAHATALLAACPTPAWWPTWLADPHLAGCTAVGFVAAAALHPGWATWAETQPPGAHVLVPQGLAPARVDHPRDPSLAPAVAAHALERWTGPVFPDPHVLALLAAPPDHAPTSQPPPTTTDAATWSQARRALPLLGAIPGMESPRPGHQPTAAAFLAQRALVRRARTTALAREPDLPARPLDDAALARAEEVLRGAGQVLSEHESKVVLRGFGVEITRQAVASSASGAAQFAEQIGYPVVLKALSPDLRRKQDVGAVVLGLTTASAVRRAYANILHSVEHHAPTARLDGVLVAEQAADGLEIECGAVRLADESLALYGRPLGLPHASEPILALSPLSDRGARSLADAVLARVPVPALRRASDPGVPELAALFLRLDALLRHFEPDLSEQTAQPGRLVSLELGPIRLVGPPRGYLTLDARIVQRAHLEGL